MELKEVNLEDCGRASKVIIKKDDTTIINGLGDKTKIEHRANEIRKQCEISVSDYDKKNLNERLAKLTSGVAILKVGAATESEMQEKKLRIEDALNATKAAVDEGVVLGGGAALVQSYKVLKDKIKAENADEQKGISAVFEAVLTPLWQIAENAGYNGSEIVDMQLKADTNIGFDAKNGKWVNLYEAGIVDPTKVTRSAILNASSIAALFLTTEAAVASVPEKKTIPSLAEPDIY
jgi:chaperonin GroEL